jgi:serine/threonine-protein kinase
LSLCEGDLLGGRYRIESLVQARPSKVHYEATDLTSGTRVAAHVLVSPPGSLGRPAEDSARASFIAGAHRAKALESAYVARVLDAGATLEGHPWLISERIASTTLATHLRQHGAIPTSEAVDVALAVCDAIAEAHEKGIVHGSLGPHAVHVAWSASGLVDIKVTGTGTAMAEAALALGSNREVECVLRAPEQLRDGPSLDPRSDVWAIGVLLHTMIAGAPPFTADAPSGASLSVILDDPPSLADVPDELAEIVERSLARDPRLRPRAVLDLAEAIVPFATDPDFWQDRIAARRRPGLELLPPESAPTIVVDNVAYAALAFERQQSAASIDGGRASTTDHGEIAPSVRDLVPEPSPESGPVLQAATATPPPVALGQRASSGRDLPTRIVRRPDVQTGSFPRRRTIKVLGVLTAAASVALLVLIGTEGARLSRSQGAPGLAPASTSALPPSEPTTNLPPPVVVAPPAPVDSAPVASAAPAPRAPSSASPASPKRGRAAALASKSSAPRTSTSPAESADDLRRFLDDRR